jgi:solute carrier family 25 (mitochondrial thiamine pyrophosphate transporter), member 19
MQPSRCMGHMLQVGERSGSRGENALQAFACGLASGVIAKLGTHPLDVAKKRFQVAGLQRSVAYGERVAADSVVSLSKCLHVIYAREGIAGFYKGALPSILKAAPSAAVTFAAYDFVMGLLVAGTQREHMPLTSRPKAH